MQTRSLPLPVLTSWSSRSKPVAVLGRSQERVDHLGPQKVTIELVQFVQPEVITVEVGIRWIIRIPPQIPEVFQLHKAAIQLPRLERRVLRDAQQRASARARVRRRGRPSKLRDCVGPFLG